MVKAKNKRKAANGQKTKVVQVMRRRVLDSRAQEYARLLVDPCGAPLCHPVYPGGDSGFLFRAESIASFGGGSTETAGIVHWCPGYTNYNSTELLVSSGATSSTSLTLAVSGTGPGRTFLGDNASAVRCVAACLKITYPGAEQARSGRIHYGHTTAGVLDSGSSVSVDDIAPLVQNYGRTPPETVEVIWRPNIADTEFNDPTANANAAIRDRKSAITVGWAGIPVSTGMTFHFTAVYEWLPKSGKGLAGDVSGKNTSSNTMDDVLDTINQGFSWVRGPLHNMASTIGVGMGRGAINALATNVAAYYGLMSARQGRAPRQRLLT